MLGPPLPLTLPGSVVLRAAKSIRWKKGWRRWYKRLTGSLPVGCYRLHYFSNTDVISCFQSCALATPFVGGYLITKIVRTRYYLRQGFTMSRPHSLVGCSNVVHMSTSAQVQLRTVMQYFFCSLLSVCWHGLDALGKYLS